VKATTTRQKALSSERGSALLMALCFAAVLAIALSSYLTLCYRSLQMSTRSMNSSHSAELAEVGLEDALWALNKNDWTDWSFSGTTATKTTSGFTFDNGATGSVTTTLTNYNGSLGTSRTFTVTGTTTLADGTTTSRTVTSSAVQAPLFTNAVAATTGLVKFTVAGTGSIIDSYDSSLGDYSTQTPGYSAIIASGSTSTSASTVQLTNAQVKGYVATLSSGPSYSTSATLKGPSTPATTRIDSSRISTSPYQPQFDIKTPSTTGATAFSAPSGNGTKHYGTAGTTTVYTCTGFDMTGSGKIILDGPVQIVMTGSAAFYLGLHGGTPQIQISSTASLEVFSAGDFAIYGGGISNATLDPKKCAIYSSNTLTVPDMNTATAFYGVIYAPGGDFSVASNNAIYGSIVARNVTFNGSSPTVHYDMNLRNVTFVGLDTPYSVSNWRDTSQ
jgi:hypothetical protein